MSLLGTLHGQCTVLLRREANFSNFFVNSKDNFVKNVDNPNMLIVNNWIIMNMYVVSMVIVNIWIIMNMDDNQHLVIIKTYLFTTYMFIINKSLINIAIYHVLAN